MGHGQTSSSAAAQSQHGLAGKLAKWGLRFSGGSEETEEPVSERERGRGAQSREIDRRRKLYNDIGDFLFAHDLDLTPLNFSVAHDYLTGNDIGMEKAVRAVLQERGQITNSWIEDAVAANRGDEITPDTLANMLEKVEENLSQFTNLVDQSRSSAKDYGAALQEQVKDLSDAEKDQPVLAKLIGLTRSMVEKTRAVETQMRESQKHTKELQRNLETARKAAEQDHLTGLPNRRAFESVLVKESEKAVEAGENIAVAFCDIDHFKNVNDTHGHDTGDRVLKFVGSLLARISGDKCHVARHGGEEFVMLFCGKTAAEACEVVDEARQDLATRNLVNRTNGERLERVTFSAGVANIRDYGDPREALKAADKALYLAKEHGRNRVYLAAPEEND